MKNNTKSPTPSSFISQEAEQAVIGSILLQPDWLDELELDPEDFFTDDYRYLFQAELALKARGENIDEASVAREAAPKVKAWVIPQVMSIVPTPYDCTYYAKIVRELAQKRKLYHIASQIVDRCQSPTSAADITDRAVVELQSIASKLKTSRAVTFSSPERITSNPPTYNAIVTTQKGVSAEISFTSADLDSPKVVKRKIRERLKVNPVLPSDFEALVHNLVEHAKDLVAPLDASEDETILYWIREWFKTAIEAETVDDFTQGYIDKGGYRYFSFPRLRKYLNDRQELKVSPPRLSSILVPLGLREKNPDKIDGKSIRLCGLPLTFFEEEEVAEEDSSWLEK